MKKLKLFLGAGLASLALTGAVSSDSASAMPRSCTAVEADYSYANSMWSAWSNFSWEILNNSIPNPLAGTVTVDYYRVDNGAHVYQTVSYPWYGILSAQGDREIAKWEAQANSLGDELDASGCWMY